MNPTPILRMLALTAGTGLLFVGCYTAVIEPLTIIGKNGFASLEAACASTPGCLKVQDTPTWEWRTGTRVLIKFHMRERASDATRRALRALTIGTVHKAALVEIEFQVEDSKSRKVSGK